MPAGKPERCPECGAGPLVPLPVGCCPDCGLQYDEHTLIWRPRRPWRIYLVYVNAAVFLPWLVRFLDLLIVYHRWPDGPTTFGAAVAAASLAWALPRLRVILTEGHRYAVVGPRGVQARTPRNRYFISWAELQRVEVWLGIPRLWRRDKRQPCLLEWIFDSDSEVAAFVETVEQAWRRSGYGPPRSADEPSASAPQQGGA